MSPELKIRLYNVGVGDCIYLRVPDGGDTRHILIDCGSMNRYSEKAMQVILNDLEGQLPRNAANQPVLDLLVVTHSHQDHMSALNTNLEWFEKLEIRRIWMSAAMRKEYEPAKKIHALWEEGRSLLQSLQGASLGAEYDDLLQYLSFSLSNTPALNAIRRDLPTGQRLYLDTATPEQELALFTDPDIHFRVLNPAHDLDDVYLGKLQGKDNLGFAGLTAGLNPLKRLEKIKPELLNQLPVSKREFRRLVTRMPSKALGFLMDAVEALENNTSLALLLEWQGKRLLFAADAECRAMGQKIYDPKENNSAWNFMWHAHKDGHLSQPLDFLKVGHHGSDNATPWREAIPAPAINTILEHLVRPGERPCQIGVSTERWSKYQRTIPYAPLMTELGSRAKNKRAYDDVGHYQEVNPKLKSKIKLEHCVKTALPQPQRTDLHYQDPACTNELYLDFTIYP